MIIKTITHDYKKVCKERKGDLPKQNFIKDPRYHPFAKEKEYVRALNATKIERLLAKPFVHGFSDHLEGIVRVENHKTNDTMISASFDGTTNIYDIARKRLVASHVFDSCPYGLALFDECAIVSQNQKVLIYDNAFATQKMSIDTNGSINHLNMNVDILISTNRGCQIYDIETKDCKQNYGTSPFDFAVYDHKANIIGAGSEDNFLLIDNRIDKEFSTMSIGTKTNSVAFSTNDRHLVTANEDTFIYLHDLRFMDKPIGTFRHHVNAVTCVDFNPNGDEFVSGSFDKTIRIWKINERRSRDVYYNKRMHNVNGIRYSNDGSFLVSGSDDGSLRIWKSEASRKLEKISKKEEHALQYANMLKEKYKDVPEIARISKHRFLPKKLKGDMKNTHEHYLAVNRKQEKIMNERMNRK